MEMAASHPITWKLFHLNNQGWESIIELNSEGSERPPTCCHCVLCERHTRYATCLICHLKVLVCLWCLRNEVPTLQPGFSSSVLNTWLSSTDPYSSTSMCFKVLLCQEWPGTTTALHPGEMLLYAKAFVIPMDQSSSRTVHLSNKENNYEPGKTLCYKVSFAYCVINKIVAHILYAK